MPPSDAHESTELDRATDIPLRKNKRKRIYDDNEKRADTCRKFAQNPHVHRPITAFAKGRLLSVRDDEWCPRKAQMSRDMTTILGRASPAQQDGGGLWKRRQQSRY